MPCARALSSLLPRCHPTRAEGVCPMHAHAQQVCHVATLQHVLQGLPRRYLARRACTHPPGLLCVGRDTYGIHTKRTVVSVSYMYTPSSRSAAYMPSLRSAGVAVTSLYMHTINRSVTVPLSCTPYAVGGPASYRPSLTVLHHFCCIHAIHT